jgi:hypothetical protein
MESGTHRPQSEEDQNEPAGEERGGEIPPGLLVDGEARKPVILSWVRLSHGRGGVVDFSQTPAPNVLAVAGGPAQAQPPEAEEGAGGERQRERWLVEPCFVERGSVRSRLFLFLFTQGTRYIQRTREASRIEGCRGSKARRVVHRCRIQWPNFFKPTWPSLLLRPCTCFSI